MRPDQLARTKKTEVFHAIMALATQNNLQIEV